MIINPVAVTFSRHELECVLRFVRFHAKAHGTGKATRLVLESAIDRIEPALTKEVQS